MKDLTKVFIDLIKLSEEERKVVYKILSKENVFYYTNLSDMERPLLHYGISENKYGWLKATTKIYLDKTELAYPEFIKLFEKPTRLPSELLREYFKNTPREQILKDWESTSDYDNVNSLKVSELFEGGEDYPGKQCQPLFDHLNQEHGLILHESEMDEIIRIVGCLNSNQ